MILSGRRVKELKRVQQLCALQYPKSPKTEILDFDLLTADLNAIHEQAEALFGSIDILINNGFSLSLISLYIYIYIININSLVCI